VALSLTACAGTAPTTPPEHFDTIIRGGTVYDGSGGAPRKADVGVRGDRVASVGDLATAQADTVIDATGRAVAPGFNQRAVLGH
jgi:N-acyl-D-amino-acid deacylase